MLSSLLIMEEEYYIQAPVCVGCSVKSTLAVLTLSMMDP